MRILLIEDDEILCQSLSLQLERQGISVDLCHNGEDGLFRIREQAHDLILLDRMLPGLDGLQVLTAMRSEQITTPVIFLTALGSLQERVTGLDCGADDYIVKPFAFEELMARIRCIGRRPRELSAGSLLSFGGLSWDPEQNLLTCGPHTCTLSRREGELMGFFLIHPEQTLPRATLLLRIWGPDSDVESGNLDNYIHFLRRRLKAVHSSLKLTTVRGVGYRLEHGSQEPDHSMAEHKIR